MVVSILFTHTKPFTADKKAEVLLLCHSLQHLNGPNTFTFPAKTKTGICFCCSQNVRKRPRQPMGLIIYKQTILEC